MLRSVIIPKMLAIFCRDVLIVEYAESKGICTMPLCKKDASDFVTKSEFFRIYVWLIITFVYTLHYESSRTIRSAGLKKA